MEFRYTTKGQTVIEVLIAFSLIGLLFSGVALIFFGNQSTLSDKELSAAAAWRAHEGIEGARAIARRDWTALTTGDHGLVFKSGEWIFEGSSTTHGIFTRVINVTSSPDYYEKNVTSRVIWMSGKTSKSFSYTVRLTDWKTVLESGGDTGGGGTASDWTNACTLGTVDLGTAVQGTDIDVINKITYITTVHAEANKNDFHIVDVTNGNSPSIFSQINTSPGLNAVDAIKDYAFVAVNNENEQLQIVDISNTLSPTTTAKYQLPNVNDSKGLSVFYNNKKVYVGTDIESGGNEFHIVDVSDKSNPSSIGSREIGGNVNAIYVRGSYAYLATSLDSKELVVLDIDDSSNVTEVGSFNATGTIDALSVFVVGNTLYLGRKGDSNVSNHEFLVLDISGTSSIKLLGSKELGVEVNDIRVRDTLAFLATSDSNKEFQVLNIDDPANITARITFNFSQNAQGADYESNFVYAAVKSNDTLRIITSQCN